MAHDELARLFDERDAETLYSELQALRSYLRTENIDTDVRVQCSDGGNWALHSGDASYDTDHTGHWGAGSIVKDDTDAQLANVLTSLVDQAMDAYAEQAPTSATVPEHYEIAKIIRHVAS